MSRPLRIEYPGAWYHVMNRGRRREDIFLSTKDYELFLTVLLEAYTSWKLEIAAYCLMPNHYHLLVNTPEGNISRCMRHINGVYTQRFNRSHKTDGQLFRGRYKAVLVAEDKHLLEVMRYIHRNPLRAGLSRDLNTYPWSSHKAYLSKAKKWNWIENSFVLKMLSTPKAKQKEAYIDFVSRDEPEEIVRFYGMKNLPSVLGNDAYKDWLREAFSSLQFVPDIPDSQELAPEPEKIITLICDYFKVTKDQLYSSRRGVENLPRDVAIFLVRRLTRKSLAKIGSYFGIERYSTVSSAVERIKLREQNDPLVRKHLSTLLLNFCHK